MILRLVQIRPNICREWQERYEVSYVWTDGLSIVVNRFANRETAQDWARHTHSDIEVLACCD